MVDFFTLVRRIRYFKIEQMVFAAQGHKLSGLKLFTQNSLALAS